MLSFLELIWAHQLRTQGLDGTTFTAVGKYPNNFTQSGQRFVLSLNYNGSNSFLFVNATKNVSIQNKRLRNKRLFIVLGNV